jgi:hypothetical protein
MAQSTQWARKGPRRRAIRAGASNRSIRLTSQANSLCLELFLRNDTPPTEAIGGGRPRDAWGFDRCLWGTDWTRAFAVVNYEQAVEPFLKADRPSDTERATLMGGACAKAYGWSPKKAVRQ